MPTDELKPHQFARVIRCSEEAAAERESMPTKQLKSLEEHNAEAMKQHLPYDCVFVPGEPCGLECPWCGNELLDDTSVYTTDIPQTMVNCKCGYRGFKVANK